MHYYEVAPNHIVRAGSDVFTYSSADPLTVGQIVEIEVGQTTRIGVVIREAGKPSFSTKAVLSTVEATALPATLLQTALWISQYYATPLATVLQTVLPRGVSKKRRAKLLGPEPASKPVPQSVTFTDDQLTAIKQLDEIHSGSALLHGITGSGKTAVYIDQAQKAVQRGASAIILVPEISLTSQLVEAFSRHLSNVILTHSKQTEAERHLAWQQALHADKPVVAIGPRSALFLPIKNLGLIVIDEMHEPSFKQEQSPRYSALRVASILARHHGAKTIMGSATPPISEYYLAEKTERPIVSMTHLARTDAVKPTVQLIDMTKRTNFSRHRFISNTLFTQIECVLGEGKQVLIFHNRRGSASTTLCENCGWSATCPRCYVPLTLHIDKHQLRCHICGHDERVPTVCPDCGSVDIIHKGIGTKLIESEIRRLFPKKIIARFDGDTEHDETVDKQYPALKDGTIDIIIGTQVIAKGLDLPNLRLVGVIQADAGLSLPDYGSDERTFQLLAQVIGRVGRSHHPTSVVIQSFQPQHPAVQLGLSQDYTGFYEQAIAMRQRAHFPPFRFLLKFTCSYKTEKAAIKNAKELANTLRTRLPNTIELLGPSPAFYERQRDSYRWQIICKSTKRADLVTAVDSMPKTHWQYELDPTSLL